MSDIPFEDYNGWRNRETWACDVHLTNDYDAYQGLQHLLKVMGTDRLAAEQLELWVNEEVEAVLRHREDGADWVRDMITDILAGLFRVDWAEIIRANTEE